jgi:small-conductance mechanosensitive channel
VFGGFALAYGYSNGDLAFSGRVSFTLLALLAGPFAFYRLRSEEKACGLSEEEWLLKEAGGASGLLSNAVTARAFGWLIIALPVILMLVIAMGTKSFSLALMIMLVVALPCVFAAYVCFRQSRKWRRIAENAGAKIW